VAEEREDDHDQFVMLKCSLEVAVENAGDGPGHATPGAGYAEQGTNQADGTA